MSYSRENQKIIDAKRAELDALEKAREPIERLPGDDYVTTNPDWIAATEAVIAAQEALKQAEKDAEKEMREAAEEARRCGPDSDAATAFRDTYHTDPSRVAEPESGCVVM